MGYHTEFRGSFQISPTMRQEHINYINQFSYTRRMKRNVEKLQNFPDSIRESVGLPIGYEGEYFVGGTGECGQDHDNSIIDHNDPPSTQPSLWCHWVINENGTELEWDGGEKFYDYIEWLVYLIDNFFELWGYNLKGIVEWRGEEWNDIGAIGVFSNNSVAVAYGAVGISEISKDREGTNRQESVKFIR